MGGRIDIETDDVADLGGELRIVGKLEGTNAVRRQAMSLPDALNRGQANAATLAINRPVQCVVSPGGSQSVRATTRSATSSGRRGVPGGRVLSRSKPSTPSSMNRACQRQIAMMFLNVPASAIAQES